MDEYTHTETLIKIGEQILAELQLLTSATKAAALLRFQNDFLVTEPQRKMYEAIDGEKDAQEIADIAGVSLRAAQLLIKDLVDNDLVNVTKRSRSKIPCKATDKIATYYAKLDIINIGGSNNG